MQTYSMEREGKDQSIHTRVGTKNLGAVLRSWDHPCPCGTLSELGQPSIGFMGRRVAYSPGQPPPGT